jgi:Lrp/AsnC family leucine-responsive transcriptional regulator
MKNKIISELRKNSRQTLTDISAKIKIPVTTLHMNIKRMESDKIIKKHTTLVDFSKFGYNSASSIIFKIERGDRQRFRDFALSNPSVNSAYEVDSGYDFMLEVIHKDQNELKLFLESVDDLFSIKEMKVFYLIKTLRKEEFLTEVCDGIKK